MREREGGGLRGWGWGGGATDRTEGVRRGRERGGRESENIKLIILIIRIIFIILVILVILIVFIFIIILIILIILVMSFHSSLSTSGLRITSGRRNGMPSPKTVDALGDEFEPAMRAGWLAYIRKTYPDGAAAAVDAIGEGTLVLDDD